MLTCALSGNYVNFGVFALYEDPVRLFCVVVCWDVVHVCIIDRRDGLVSIAVYDLISRFDPPLLPTQH